MTAIAHSSALYFLLLATLAYAGMLCALDRHLPRPKPPRPSPSDAPDYIGTHFGRLIAQGILTVISLQPGFGIAMLMYAVIALPHLLWRITRRAVDTRSLRTDTALLTLMITTVVVIQGHAFQTARAHGEHQLATLEAAYAQNGRYPAQLPDLPDTHYTISHNAPRLTHSNPLLLGCWYTYGFSTHQWKSACLR